MKRNFILICILLITLFSQNAMAQAPTITPSVLNAGGGYYANVTAGPGVFEVDYSIGEITLVSSVYTPTLTVTQGLLQNDHSIPVKVITTTMANSLQVYPNPASTMVTIDYSSQQAGTLHCRMLDILGSVFYDKSQQISIGTARQVIDIMSLAAGNYLLEVTFSSQGQADENATYKIQKLQ